MGVDPATNEPQSITTVTGQWTAASAHAPGRVTSASHATTQPATYAYHADSGHGR